jgi:hypothetical protein
MEIELLQIDSFLVKVRSSFFTLDLQRQLLPTPWFSAVFTKS